MPYGHKKFRPRRSFRLMLNCHQDKHVTENFHLENVRPNDAQYSRQKFHPFYVLRLQLFRMF